MKIEDNKIPSIKVKEHHNSNLLKITIFGITIKKNTHFQLCELWDEKIFEFVKTMRRLPNIELNSNGWFLDNDYKRLRILISDIMAERMAIFLSQPRSISTSYHKDISTLTKNTESIQLSTSEQSRSNLYPLLTESISRMEWDHRYTSLPDNIATSQIIEDEKSIKVISEYQRTHIAAKKKKRRSEKSKTTNEKSNREKSIIINDDNDVSNMETIKKKIKEKKKLQPRLRENSKQSNKTSTTLPNESQTNKDDQLLFLSAVEGMNGNSTDIDVNNNKLLQTASSSLPKVDDMYSFLNVQAFDVFEEDEDSESGDDSGDHDSEDDSEDNSGDDDSGDDDSDGSKSADETSDSEDLDEMII